MNEYKPWEELGQTEVEYWKARYLENAKRIDELMAMLEKAEIVAQSWENDADAAHDTLNIMGDRRKKAEAERDAAIREIGVQGRAHGLAEAENDRLRDALKLLVIDVAYYEAWQRPCYALDKAKAALDKGEMP